MEEEVSGGRQRLTLWAGQKLQGTMDGTRPSLRLNENCSRQSELQSTNPIQSKRVMSENKFCYFKLGVLRLSGVIVFSILRADGAGCSRP